MGTASKGRPAARSLRPGVAVESVEVQPVPRDVGRGGKAEDPLLVGEVAAGMQLGEAEVRLAPPQHALGHDRAKPTEVP